jgi:hypothetical protein
MENKKKISWWIGTILKGLITLFLLFDAIMKIIKNPQAVEGTKQLGLPENCLMVLGAYLFIYCYFIIPI